MTNRMAIATLALIGMLIALYMTAYKFGFLGGIMCGTGSCEVVQNSPFAVQFGIPVPLIGLLGYGTMLVLALLGLQTRFEDARWIPTLLVAGAVIGVIFSAYLSWLEQYRIQAWCRWCIVSAVIAVLLLIFSIPEFARMRRPATAE